MTHISNRLPGEGNTQPKISNPRELRLLSALLYLDLSRERLDRVVGCSNGPDLVMRLRNREGLELPCPRQKGSDRDGNPVKYGVYRPTPEDKRIMRALLNGSV